MATSILFSTFPVGAPTRTCERYRQLDRPRNCRATCLNSSGSPLSENESAVAFGRESGLGGRRASVFSQGRRELPVRSQENDEGTPQVDDAKPFYAAVEFWIQVAVVTLTVGFVDAGYSRDWSRIGAISQETEAQLRIAAYVVVPSSAALVWIIGTRKKTP